VICFRARGPLAPAQLLKFWLSPQVLGLLDQAIVSISNFSVTWILAWKLPASEYGLYAIVNGLILTLNSIQSSLLVFPFTITYAGADLPNWQSGVVRYLLLSFGAAPVQALIIAIGCVYLNHLAVAVFAIAALCLWQAQEVIRRAMFQRGLFLRAIATDCVRYIVPLIFVALLPRPLLGTRNVLLFIGSASIAAALPCLGTFSKGWREAFSLYAMKREIRASWNIGRSMVLFNAAGSALNQGALWILGSMQGLAGASRYQAINNLMGITNPPIFGIAAVRDPAVARAYSRSGARSAIGASAPYIGMIGALVLPALGVFAAFPGWVLLHFYGRASPYSSLGGALQIATVWQLLAVGSQVAASILACIDRVNFIWRVQMVTSGACLLVMVPLVRWGGLYGCFICLSVSSAAALAVMSQQLRTASREGAHREVSGKEAVMNA
jgi:O-antigen/teichoic acid export membrane protein